MTTLLLTNADVVVTMDLERREIKDGAVFVRDNLIEAVGPSSELPADADRVVDLRGKVVLPGMVNTHHHLYQTLTRCLPETQDAPLFSWLQALYPIWARLTPEAVYLSALVGLAVAVKSFVARSDTAGYHVAEFRLIAGRKLGTYLAGEYRDKKAILIRDPGFDVSTELQDTFLQGIKETITGKIEVVAEVDPGVPKVLLRDATAGAEVDGLASTPSPLGPAKFWLTPDAFDDVAEKYKHKCDLVISAVGLPCKSASGYQDQCLTN